MTASLCSSLCFFLCFVFVFSPLQKKHTNSTQRLHLHDTFYFHRQTCVNRSAPLFLFHVTVLLLINQSGRSTHDSKAHRKLDNIKWAWMHSKNIDRRGDIISIFWNHYIRCAGSHAFQTTSLQTGCFILMETFPWRLFILIKLLFWNFWTTFLWKSRITLHIKVLWLSWHFFCFFLDCRKLQTECELKIKTVGYLGPAGWLHHSELKSNQHGGGWCSDYQGR